MGTKMIYFDPTM